MGSVLTFTRHPEGRTGAVTDTAEHDFAVTYTAVTSDPTVSELTVLLDSRCPRPFDIFTASDGVIDPGAWCVGVTASVDSNDPTVWHVTARYSNKINRPDLWEIRNPLLRPAVVEYDAEEVLVPLEYDADGNPVRDAAEMRFDPPPEKEEVWQVMRVTKNLTAFDAMLWLQHNNAVNSSAWNGYPTGYVRCRRPRAARMFENGVWFWQCSAEFVARPLPTLRGKVIMTGAARGQTREPWDRAILNAGLYERKAAASSRSGAVSGSTCPVRTTAKFCVSVSVGSTESACLLYAGNYELTWTTVGCAWGGANSGGKTATLSLNDLASVSLEFSGGTRYLCSDFTEAGGGTFQLDQAVLEGTTDCEWPQTLTVTPGACGEVAPADVEAELGRCGSDGFVRTEIISPRTLQPVTVPWPLDEDGAALPLCADPVWLVFRYRPRKDFNLLNLF